MTNLNSTLPRRTLLFPTLICLLILAVTALGYETVDDDGDICARLIEGLEKSVYRVELKDKKIGTVYTLGFVVDTVPHPVVRRDLLLGCSKINIKSMSGKKYKNKGIHSDSEDHNLARICVPSKKKKFSGLETAIPEITDTVLLVQLSADTSWSCWEGIVTDDRRIPGFGRLFFVATSAPPSDELQLVLSGRGKLIGWRGRQALPGADVAYVIPAGQLTVLHRARVNYNFHIGSRESDLIDDWKKKNVDLLSKRSDSLYVLGLNHLWEGRLDIARRLFNELALAEPSFGPGWFYKGTCDEIFQSPALANAAYENALRYDQDFAKAHLASAKLSHLSNSWSRFSKSASAQLAAVFDPGSAEALVVRAFHIVSPQLADGVIEQCGLARKIDPEVPGTERVIALAYWYKSDFEAAIAAAEVVLAIDSADVTGILIKAESFLGLEQFEESVTFYQQGLDLLETESADIYFSLGRAYTGLKQHAKASEAYWQATEIKPDYKEAHCNLAAAYRKQKLWQLALNASSKALMLDPYFPQARCSKGLTHAEMKDEAAARSELQILREMKSDYYNVLKKAIDETDFDSDE
ncbi:MAG: tetratricopeptide repeat protein [candidate division Zixibacteria bacterium]|nr:tetratricopeptide repeat protein [candidate division Zixibacteria bacterium]